MTQMSRRAGRVDFFHGSLVRRLAVGLTFLFVLTINVQVAASKQEDRSLSLAAPRGATDTPTSSPTPSPSATPLCGLGWRVVASPNGDESDNRLNGIAALASNDVWAVGYSGNPAGSLRTLIEHWDGTRWSVMPSPNVGDRSNALFGVAAISSADVWAVGVYASYPTVAVPLAMHWDGARWEIVHTLQEERGGFMTGVSATAGNDIWAVGDDSTIEDVAHIAGSHGASDSSSVFVTQDSDAPEGGYSPLVWHWDGYFWSRVPPPPPPPAGIEGSLSGTLHSVAAIGRNDAWAVGSYDRNTVFQPLITHWDGHQWNLSPNPLFAVDSGLNDIAALSANNVWVVGHAGNGTIGDALIEHWDGSAWNVVPAPNPGAGRILEGVSALAANDIWAVGHIGYGFPTISVRTLTMHWDGATWTEVPSPNFKPDGSMLLNVAAVSPGDVWAVGTTGRYQHISTLAEHYTADNFTDVHPADYFYDAVNYLACHGMVSGYADTTFHPYAGATRAQLCKIITLAEGWTVDCPPSGHFSDVQPGSPFYCFVETAYTHGIISGYADGTFRPGSNVTRSQLCKIIVLAEEWAPYTPPAPTFQDVSANSPFYGYIETAYNHAIISGYGCGPGCLVFRPGNHAIRGQICKIVYLAITSP